MAIRGFSASGLYATPYTGPVCNSSENRSDPVSVFHTFNVPSDPADASDKPSGLYAKL